MKDDFLSEEVNRNYPLLGSQNYYYNKVLQPFHGSLDFVWDYRSQKGANLCLGHNAPKCIWQLASARTRCGTNAITPDLIAEMRGLRIRGKKREGNGQERKREQGKRKDDPSYRNFTHPALITRKM